MSSSVELENNLQSGADLVINNLKPSQQEELTMQTFANSEEINSIVQNVFNVNQESEELVEGGL